MPASSKIVNSPMFTTLVNQLFFGMTRQKSITFLLLSVVAPCLLDSIAHMLSVMLLKKENILFIKSILNIDLVNYSRIRS